MSLPALGGRADLPVGTAPTVTHALQAGDCNLCHQTPGVAAASRQDSCAVCHIWVRAVAADPAKRGAALQVFPLWERYEKNVGSYLNVPSIEAGFARLDPAWVRAWLSDPHDVRPGLYEGMPRFALTAAELDLIQGAVAAANHTPDRLHPPDAANVAAGAALFSQRGCAACHGFGALHAGPAVGNAPDLAHARDRMTDDMIVAWIADPRAVSPAATMPNMGLTPQEAVAIRDYLVLAEPGWVDAAPAGPPPEPATRPVAWAEVEEKVFGRICVHCHMDPAQNQGRAGPGNAGGFGWPATGIQLQTREGVAAAADQVRASLLRRRDEAHRDTVAPGQRPATLDRPKLPGMPLGLPPIPDEDIALVLAWFDQGMPE